MSISDMIFVIYLLMRIYDLFRFLESAEQPLQEVIRERKSEDRADDGTNPAREASEAPRETEKGIRLDLDRLG